MLRSATFAQLSRLCSTAQFLPWSATSTHFRLFLSHLVTRQRPTSVRRSCIRPARVQIEGRVGGDVKHSTIQFRSKAVIGHRRVPYQ